MEALIYNPFANKNAGLLNIVAYFTAFFSGGISAHDETRFTVTEELIAYSKNKPLLYNGKTFELKEGLQYITSMTTKGFVIQTWEDRKKELKSHDWKGGIDVIHIPNADLIALWDDILRVVAIKPKYGFIKAFYSSTNKTFLGSILRFFGVEKGMAEFCSAVATVQRLVSSPTVRANIDPKHTVNLKAMRDFAREQTPVESRALLLKKCKFTNTSLIFD